VKVLISGEGGDEGFGGYQIYRNLLWLGRLKSVLKPMNGSISRGLLRLNPYLKSGLISKYAPPLGVPFEDYYQSGTSNAFNFFSRNLDALYSKEFAPFVNNEASVSVVKRHVKNSANRDQVNRMLYVDTKTWLVDDLLLKADKMTMAASLELRVPFLDHKVLEFAASLPGKYKVHGFTTKYILKKVLSNRVPQEILNRKKVGFPVPYNAWLRNDLKDWIRDLLLDRETLQRGYFNRDCIERLISQNTALGGSYSKEVFSLAVLELWHREFLGNQQNSLRQDSFDPAAGLMTST
jgi:asparagine synthase (glutamine-hydrolysing)